MASNAGEIGSAYVALYVKMPGVDSDIRKMLGAADTETPGETAGKKYSSGFSTGLATLTGAIAGIVSSVTSKAFSLVTDSIGSAISRVDTMANFSTVMSNLGYSADDASASISAMSDRLTGLPTTMDSMASMVQQLSAITGNLSSATDIGLAFNDMMLASGASTADQERAFQQYSQILSRGTVDLESWRTLQEVMPGQLKQVAQALLGTSASTNDLYTALQSGTLSTTDFTNAIINLDSNGVNGMASFADQAKGATSGIATSWTNMQTAITRGLANVISTAKPQITAFIGYASEVVSGLFSGFKNLVSWVSANSTWLGPLVVGLLAGVVAVETWTTVTKLAAAAQAAFNVVMNANPIMLVVTAIAALVAGLVWFFTQTELGQQIWSGFVSWFQALISGFSAWWSSIWTSVGNFFTGLWQGVSSFFTGLWNGITAFIRGVLNLFVSWFMNWTVYGIIISHWQEISNFFVSVWNGIKSFVSSAINNVSSTVSRVLSAIGNGWNSAWRGISDFFVSVWNGIKSFISSAINSVSSTVSRVLSAIGHGWNSAWRGMSDFVSGVFQGLVGVIKRPVNAIISVVNSMINGLNRISIDLPDWVGDLTGVYSIGFDIPNIPQLATGGTITRGGMALVGERGPELVSLPTGSTVYDAYQTASALPGGATLNVNVSGRSYQSPAALGEVIGVKVAQAIGGVR